MLFLYLKKICNCGKRFLKLEILYQVFSYLSCVREYPNREEASLRIIILWHRDPSLFHTCSTVSIVESSLEEEQTVKLAKMAEGS